MRNQIKTVLLLGALSAFLIGLGGALGPAYLYGEDPHANAFATGRSPSRGVVAVTTSLFIVNPFAGMGGALRSLLSTHPPMGERVRRLRAMAYGRYVRAA
jgi:Zn-dependent protease with chaperone function